MAVLLMRLDPETFERIRSIFFVCVVVFVAYVAVRMVMSQTGTHPPPRRAPGAKEPPAESSADTHGLGGASASDTSGGGDGGGASF